MTPAGARSENARVRPGRNGAIVSPPPPVPPGFAQAILDATASLVIVADIRTGTVVAINSAAQTVIGLSREEVAGRFLWEICPPDDRDAVAGLFAGSQLESPPQTYEATTVSTSGAHHRIVWSNTFLTGATGERTHIVMTGVDITSGSATSGLFGQLMHAATTIVLIGTDPGGRVTFCSSGAEQMLDATHLDLTGRLLPAAAFGSGEQSVRIARGLRPDHTPILEVEISPQDRRGARRLDLGPLERRSDRSELGAAPSHTSWRRSRDWLLRQADGSRLIAEMTVTPVTDALGEGAGYLFTGSDVTEQRRSRDLLVSRLAKEAAATERLRELDRIKDDLVATVSHELRTPLTNILGSVELLQDEAAGPLTARQRKMADAMARNGDRLLALVDDLLTVSIIDAGQLRSGSTPLDLRDVVTSARRSLQPLIGARQLVTHFRLPATPVVVHGDADQLEQVVCNLIDNAVKFTEDGGTVECVLSTEGSRARLTVSDDGIGIPEDEQRGLFRRFFRSTTATDRAIQGAGLGLSIASSIVRSHSGEISVVSAPGRGTRVVVDLPTTPSP